jgi:hypothetical protein
MMGRLLFASLLATCLAACGEDGAGPADAGVADAATPDAAPPDAATPDGAGATRVETTSVPLGGQLDILFVVDDSSSMVEEQQALIASFPAFVAELESFDGGLPDVHIGVISTDVGAGAVNDGSCRPGGDDGTLQIGAGCGITTDERFLRSAPAAGGRATNFTGSLGEAFGCIARLGTNGCGFEQPFESIRRALGGDNPANAGFRRPGAQLAIVLLSDEDDCSATDDELFRPPLRNSPGDPVYDQLGPRDSFRCFEQGVTCDQAGRDVGERTGCASNESGRYVAPVAGFARFLRDLGGPGSDDDGAIALAGIYGLGVDDQQPAPVRVGLSRVSAEPELLPVCEQAIPGGGARSAVPAVRFAELLDAFPGRATESSICNDSYAGVLRGVADLVRQPRGPDCIGGWLADVDPAAGLQVDCAVALVTAPGTAGEASIDVVACSTTGDVAPCWQLVTDAAACPAADHQAVSVRLGTTSLPAETYQRRSCTLVAP